MTNISRFRVGFRNFGLNTCANARKFTGHICSPIITGLSLLVLQFRIFLILPL
jgi:hypothetical protein